MHLEIESTVIAAANPEGQVSFFRLLPHLPTFSNNRPRSGFETDQHLILYISIQGIFVTSYSVLEPRLKFESMVYQQLGLMRTKKTGRLL